MVKVKYSKKYRRKNFKNRKSKRKTTGGNPVANLACNPIVVKNRLTATKDTCITNSLLEKIIDFHNKQNPNTLLNTKDFSKQQILKILREKNDKCKTTKHTDLCIVKSAGLNSNGVFAPKHDWKTPREWLSNFDIKMVMDMYEDTYPEFHFFGPVPIDFDTPTVCPNNGDNLCNFNLENELKSKKTKFGIIFNLDFDKGRGTHWVSLFYDSNPQNPVLFFFDSAGKNNTPPDRFAHIKVLTDNIIDQAKKKFGTSPLFDFNKKRHQNGNTECGVYSLFFIITMLTRKTDGFQEKEMNNNELLNFFKNGNIPDNLIEQYRSVFFTEPQV